MRCSGGVRGRVDLDGQDGCRRARVRREAGSELGSRASCNGCEPDEPPTSASPSQARHPARRRSSDCGPWTPGASSCAGRATRGPSPRSPTATRHRSERWSGAAPHTPQAAGSRWTSRRPSRATGRTTSPSPARDRSATAAVKGGLPPSSSFLVTSSTPTPTPTPPPVVVAGPTGPADLRARTDLIYGSEIGRGGPTEAPPGSSGSPPLQAAEIPVIRFSMHDVFTDMQDPPATPGTQTPGELRHRAQRHPRHREGRAHPSPSPSPTTSSARRTGRSSARRRTGWTATSSTTSRWSQAGTRVRLYESTNEMDTARYRSWGFTRAGSIGVSRPSVSTSRRTCRP